MEIFYTYFYGGGGGGLGIVAVTKMHIYRPHIHENKIRKKYHWMQQLQYIRISDIHEIQ